MAEPFLGEVKIFSGTYPPKGWADCNGQLLPINQYQALFALLGTTFGGDGRSTFALPNLITRVPVHAGPGFLVGQAGGEQSHSLTLAELPAHAHAAAASSAPGNTPNPAGNVLASPSAAQLYDAGNSGLTAFLAASLGSVGGSQSHSNLQPFLTLRFCIALQGIFPSQN